MPFLSRYHPEICPLIFVLTFGILTGTILELLDDNNGWFQFCVMEGDKVQEISSSVGNVYQSHRWYVPGTIEQMKQSPIKSSSVKHSGNQFGFWKASLDGENIILVNSVDGKSQIHLQSDGFTYLNCANDEALVVDGLSGKLLRRPLKSNEWHKPA